MITRRHFLPLLSAPLLAQERRIAPVKPGKPGDNPGNSNVVTGRRVALTIGNNAYQHASVLKNATHDAADIAKVLEKSKFTVTTLLDANQMAIRQGIEKFVSGLQQGDVALLFYSGHGVQIDGENYLVPVDFNPDTGEAQAKAFCASASAAQRAIEKSAGLTILILDACRDNPFRANYVPGRGLALMEGELGCYLALAAGPGQTASDNPGDRNGLFTSRLLAEMNRPGQSLDHMLTQVKQQVFDASKGKQRPWLHADVIGEFYFEGHPSSGSTSPGAGEPTVATNDYLAMGQRQFQAKEFDQAAQSFERAMRMRPEDPYVYNALGATYTQLRKWSLAVGLYAKAIDLKPDYAAAYFNRGVAYFNAGRYELAAQDFSWAIDTEPYDPQVLDLRGRTYLALLDYDNALADFNHALELNASDSLALLGRGKIHFRQGRFPDALRDLTASVQIKPSAEGFEARAQANRSSGHPREAEADLREAAKLK